MTKVDKGAILSFKKVSAVGSNFEVDVRVLRASSELQKGLLFQARFSGNDVEGVRLTALWRPLDSDAIRLVCILALLRP